MNAADALPPSLPDAETATVVAVSPDFLTVGDGAAHFAVPPRTLRRAIERYQETGPDTIQTRQVTRHTKTGNRSATAYPFALVSRLAGEIRAAGGEAQTNDAPLDAPETVTTGQAVTQEDAASAARNIDNVDKGGERGGNDAALIAQLQSENARLWAALDQSNANVGALTAELSEARKQHSLVLGAVAANRLQITPQESAGGDSTGDTAASGQSAQPEKRPFWSRVFGSKEGR